MTKLIKIIITRAKRITPFEWLVLLIVVFIAVFIVKYFGKGEEWRTIRVEVVGKDWSNTYGAPIMPPFWLAEKITTGDMEKDAGGKVIAEVVKVERYERLNNNVDLLLTVKIKTKINKRMGKYIYKGKALEVGVPIELRFSHAFVLGQIIDDQVPPGGYETKEVIITGRARGRELYHVAQVNSGDKMIDSGSGEILAEILTTRIEPSTTEILFNEGDGVLVIEKSLTKRDLVLTVKIKVMKYGDKWYFAGNQKVKVNKSIRIILPETELPWVWIEDVQGLEL